MVTLHAGRAVARLLAMSAVGRPMRMCNEARRTHHRAIPSTLAPRSGRSAMCTSAAVDSELGRRLRDGLAKAIEGESRKRASLMKEQAAAADAEALSRWATLVTANLYQIPQGASSATVEDWERNGAEVTLRFDLDKYASAREEADAAFTKARKLRRGSDVVQKLLEQSEATCAKLSQLEGLVAAAAEDGMALELARDEVVLTLAKLRLKPIPLAGGEEPPSRGGGGGRGPRGQGPKPKRGPQKGWAGRRFVSPSGVPILVGRNRAENEALSLTIAREPDVWFHVRGSPGAHVILQLSSASREARRRAAEEGTPEECLQLAADLAAHYSELKGERRARVAYTTPKHLSKPNGAPLGAVSVRKELGTVVGYPENVIELAAEELVRRGADGVGPRRRPPPPPPDP